MKILWSWMLTSLLHESPFWPDGPLQQYAENRKVHPRPKSGHLISGQKRFSKHSLIPFFAFWKLSKSWKTVIRIEEKRSFEDPKLFYFRFLPRNQVLRLRGRPKMTSLKGGRVDFFCWKWWRWGGGLAAKPPKEIPQGEGGEGQRDLKMMTVGWQWGMVEAQKSANN